MQTEQGRDRSSALLAGCELETTNLLRMACPEPPQQHGWVTEESPTDQQLCNRGTASSLDHEEPEPLLIKVEQDEADPLQFLEQEEFCSSQDEEQFVLKQEAVISLVTPTDEERNHIEPEPNRNQLLFSMFPGAEIRQQKASRNEKVEQSQGSPQTRDHREDVDLSELQRRRKTHSACPEPPQHHVRVNEEDVTDQQRCNQETTSNLDQEEPEHPLIKEEPEEHCISQHEELSILKQEKSTFMGTFSEESDCWEPEPNRNQPLCQGSTEAENQAQDGCSNENSKSNGDEELKQNKRCKKNKDQRGERSFSCEICGKCFSLASKLAVHMRSHTGEKPYPCETCGKCFSQSGHLGIHMRTHTGEKPYSCETCGRCFSRSSELTFHIRTHTGEKPYPCEVCGKCFSQSSKLTDHMRTHTGEKPYPCDFCGKCFSRSGQLTVHLRTHTGEKPYPCETCGRCFAQRGSLTKHMTTHKDEKSFLCLICGKRFSQLSSFTSHMKLHI
nr:zinc finger protein OZF-like [Nothobranchius furzeri]